MPLPTLCLSVMFEAGFEKCFNYVCLCGGVHICVWGPLEAKGVGSLQSWSFKRLSNA